MSPADGTSAVSTQPGMKYDAYPRNPGYSDLAETHRMVVDAVPSGSRVLELGCATGYLGKVLTRERGCSVVGVEVDADAASMCEGYERVVVADLDDPTSLDWDELGSFDVVMASAVLEHLLEPERVLVSSKEKLNSPGTVVVNLPNVAHWTIRSALLGGHWDYTDRGIMDRTHVRFYTVVSAEQMFSSCGLNIEQIGFTFGPRPAILKALSVFLGGRRFRDYICGRYPSLFGQEMIIRATAT
jgi:methionine biosynthesis protein MetW